MLDGKLGIRVFEIQFALKHSLLKVNSTPNTLINAGSHT